MSQKGRLSNNQITMNHIDRRIAVTTVKLTAAQKKIFTEYLLSQRSARDTAKLLGMTTQRIYSMSNTMLRHMASTGKLNTRDFLSNF